MKGFTCHIWYKINCGQKPVNSVCPCNLWYSRLTISLQCIISTSSKPWNNHWFCVLNGNFGFHVFPRRVSCFPVNIHQTHSCEKNNRAQQCGHMLRQIWNGYHIDHVKCFTCYIWCKIKCSQKASKPWLCLATYGTRGWPSRCLPFWGFMFSLVGFHVFPSLMRFAPTWRAGASSVRHPSCCHRRIDKTRWKVSHATYDTRSTVARNQ